MKGKLAMCMTAKTVEIVACKTNPEILSGKKWGIAEDFEQVFIPFSMHGAGENWQCLFYVHEEQVQVGNCITAVEQKLASMRVP